MLREDYLAERSDFARLLESVGQLQSAKTEDLQSLPWLMDVIRHVGLVPIPGAEQAYGSEAEYMNSSQQGIIQIPEEFAEFLLLLGAHRPSSYLEVGSFNGATASLAAAYLQRFNPAFEAVTIDVLPTFLFYPEIRTRLPLRYEVGKTSFDFRSRDFDAVFIDGDHSFEWAMADFHNAGCRAQVCAFHDVNNAPYREYHLGGVCGVWDVLRSSLPPGETRSREILRHPAGAECMGIGVLLNPREV